MRTTSSKQSIQSGRDTVVSKESIKKDLSQCLVAETKAVAKVCSEIVSWTGRSSDVSSWINPNESVSLIDILKDNVMVRDYTTDYSACLEKYLDMCEDLKKKISHTGPFHSSILLVFNSIHTYLQLMTEYLNSLPTMTNESKRPSSGSVRRRISLPALVGMFWSRLQIVAQNVYSNTASQMATSISLRQMVTTGTQTSFSSLGCEVCRMTAEAIQSLVSIASKNCQHLEGCKLIPLRNEMKNDVFDITQWGAMNKWCLALQSDIALLGAHCKQLSSSVKVGQNRLKELQNEKAEAEKKLSSLCEQKELMRRNSTKAIESRANYCKKYSELNEKYQQKSKECAEAYFKIKKLEDDVQSYQKIINEKQQSSVKERMQNSELIKKFKVKSNENERLVEELQKRNEKLSQEINALRDEASLRGSEFVSSKNYAASLEKKLSEATARTKKLEEELRKEKSHATEIWKKLNETRQAHGNDSNVDAISKRLQELEEHIYSAIPSGRFEIR